MTKNPDATRLSARVRALSPFWVPLSDVARAQEEARTREFLAAVGPDAEREAMRRFRGFEPPAAVEAAFTADPVVRRLLVYTFNPQRNDATVWRPLRAFVDVVRDARYFVGLQPSLMAEGIPSQWCELITLLVYAVDYAQRSREAGDLRRFRELMGEFRDSYLGHTETTDEGTVHVSTLRFVGGGGVTSRLLTRTGCEDWRLDGSQRDEVVFELPRSTVSADEFREYIDQTTIRRMQQFAWAPDERDVYFATPRRFERVGTLQQDGMTEAERPMHLATSYAGLVERLARSRGFERTYRADPQTGLTERITDREVGTQEALMALFESATKYEQHMGCVPGVLNRRTRGSLTGRLRDAAVSHKLLGKRQLAGEVEHSGETALVLPVAEDGEPRQENVVEAGVARDYVVHGEREGAVAWADDGVERVACGELLAPLTERQRALAVLLMRGLTAADAARELGISAVAVSKMTARIRQTLRLTGTVRA